MNSMKGKVKIGRVVLSLDNDFILSDEKLSQTPSQTDGLDPQSEYDLRILGCELIQTAGILLKLPQVAMGSGQVLFQRFYYSVSMINNPVETTAMACIYLASKIEEEPRRIRDIMNVFHHLKQITNQKIITPMILDVNYILQKKNVIRVERKILKELGFAVHVKHPNKLIVVYLQILAIDTKTKCTQMAWNYMNDALRTDVFMRYQPETIACACIYLSARMLKVSLPKSPQWFKIFKVTEESIKDVCFRILGLYKRAKPNAQELFRRVTELERRKEDALSSAKLKQAEICKFEAAQQPKLDTNGFLRTQSEPNIKLSESKSDSSPRQKHSSKSRYQRERNDDRNDRPSSPQRSRRRRRRSKSRGRESDEGDEKTYSSRHKYAKSDDEPRDNSPGRDRRRHNYHDENYESHKKHHKSHRHKKKDR